MSRNSDTGRNHILQSKIKICRACFDETHANDVSFTYVSVKVTHFSIETPKILSESLSLIPDCWDTVEQVARLSMQTDDGLPL